MEYEEVKLLKQNDRVVLHLVRENDSGHIFFRRVLRGKYPIYSTLKKYEHPYMPKIYESVVTEESTTVIEEYIEGETADSQKLSEKQVLSVIRDVCSVVEFLHGKGIIHRDIKPSNIILAQDGHIRLIDFEAARMPKEDLEQDTRLLGTRGYAPPEQYGFSQTDERTDIYAMGITFKLLFGEKAQMLRYRRIIRKCTELDPDKRYYSVRQVKNAFFHRRQKVLYGIVALLAGCFLWSMSAHWVNQQENIKSEEDMLVVLPSPENPHWDGDTGMALWGNVPESGVGGEVKYNWKLYRMDDNTPPDLEQSICDREDTMRGNIGNDEIFDMSLSKEFEKNGFYYFAVSAVGDGVNYSDSPYVLSDAFEFTGEDAPPLPAPTGLAWRIKEGEEEREYYITWSNFDDYADGDCFDVYIYDKNNEYVMNTIVTKERILEKGYCGIRIRPEFLTEVNGAYRFTLQAYSSRPNEYKASVLPDPVTEEYYSPWYYYLK